jgi:uncharacterized protein
VQQPVHLLQLSDIHFDWNTQEWLEQLKRLINQQAFSQQPYHAIVLTGDYITSGSVYLPALTDWLKTLLPNTPKIACMGNHDYYDGAKGAATLKALQAAGVEVLINTVTTLPNNPGLPFVIAGLDDYVKGKPNPTTVLEALNQSPYTHYDKLLLCHNPKQLACQKQSWMGFSLILSGHTHGGQFKSPLWFAKLLSEAPYVSGLHTIEGSPLYVNNATGTASLPIFNQILPVPRWGMQPEITNITLLPANPVH